MDYATKSIPVLLITDVDFWNGGAGHRVRIANLVNVLASKVQLTVAFAGVIPTILATHISNTYAVQFITLGKQKPTTPNMNGRCLRSYLKSNYFSSIIIEYIHNSYFLNYIDLETRLILDTHDIISDRTIDFKAHNFKGQSFELDLKSEIEILNLYDHVMLICEPDYLKIRKLISPEKALLCPPSLDVSKQFLRREVKNIAFVASEYLPNIDGIEQFLEHVWPTISSKFSLQLCIYGNICRRLPTSFIGTNVTIKGYVSSLAQIYFESDIIINPVRFGAGIKIKNLEALAYGVPLVTTTHGARGLEAGINKAFLVANEPDEFITSLVFLINSYGERQKLSENSHRFMKLNFSAEKSFQPLLNKIMMI